MSATRFKSFRNLKIIASLLSSAGPCALENITVVAECSTNLILVTWEMAMESPLYLVTAEAPDQSLISCNSSSYFCELEGADCGTLYVVIVSASSDKCSSLHSPPMEVHTGKQSQRALAGHTPAATYRLS